MRHAMRHSMHALLSHFAESRMACSCVVSLESQGAFLHGNLYHQHASSMHCKNRARDVCLHTGTTSLAMEHGCLAHAAATSHQHHSTYCSGKQWLVAHAAT